jgi:hypothetical protein
VKGLLLPSTAWSTLDVTLAALSAMAMVARFSPRLTAGAALAPVLVGCVCLRG